LIEGFGSIARTRGLQQRILWQNEGNPAKAAPLLKEVFDRFMVAKHLANGQPGARSLE
jgi:hypothetical protein